MGTAIDYVREELRLLRVQVKLSQDDFGRGIGYSGSHVSSVETGGRPPTKEYMFAVDRAHDPAFDPQAGEGRFTRMLRELSKLEQTPSWLREWIELERDATLLRWYEPAFLPGLLQTEAYARGMMNNGLLLPDEIDHRVASRLDRQSVLTRDAPVPLVAVIDVMVLRRQVDGRPEIMREQLDHLVKMSELPHVQILVVPEDAAIYPGLQGGFILATVGDGSVVGHLDHQVRAQVVSQTEDLVTLQRTWEAVRDEALPRRQSLELIKEVAQTWT
ncbi:helix-turn-helix transcriptional regulator [Micromonospora sp. NPDC049903]|uniref:helix-turn-helix transcriptional regulator n=1 Tax=Micromonospora sp. NPDC049903 TaxID=3364276 RepID=UPI0037B75608